MSKFHEEFFEDLREDLLIRGKNSILYQYFYKEKEEHPFVKIKRSLYELQKGEFIRKNAISQMQEDLTENQSFKKVLDELGEYPTQKGYLNKEQQMFWLENLYALLRKPTNAQKAVRRKSSEHICIDLLCEYYEIKRMQIIQSKGNRPLEMELQSIETFLADAEAALKKSKAGKQRKEALRKAIDELRYQPDMEHVIRVKDQTLELYLYGDVAQYLYNVGYPLPRDDNSMLENIAPRVKTIPVKLLDFYQEQKARFVHRGVSEIDKNNTEDFIDTMQEVYNFARDHELREAVIPLQIDSESGIGLYVLGEEYLQIWGWNTEYRNPQQAKIAEILGESPCCYAIIYFQNISVSEENRYIWAPYTLTDQTFISTCQVNPREMIFSDAKTALNMYLGRINATSNEVREDIYYYFREVNQVELDESDINVNIKAQFKKYFPVKGQSEVGLQEEIAAVKKEQTIRKKLFFSDRQEKFEKAIRK